jgi:predicted ribonuclease YlaK
MSKKAKRKIKNGHDHNEPQVKSHFALRTISPLTPNQELAFKAFQSDDQIILHGVAGTGKTYISLWHALKEVLNPNSKYKRIIIVRSVVPSRDMGFLPGTAKEKAKVYEEPYQAICDDLFGRGDGYEILKTRKLIEFTTTSFLRGLTFDDSIIIVDEVQNLAPGEIHTIMTRVGERSRIIFCGDFRQSDLAKETDRKGLLTFMRIADRMECFTKIEFQANDIVRSKIVKQYILAALELGIT